MTARAKAPVIVCGAGLAGLSCARALHAAGVQVRVLEAASHVGGRVTTVEHEGFLLDVGFQVLLTGYPEAKAQLDFGGLQLGHFGPGSLIRLDGQTTTISDPWRDLVGGARTLLSPAVSLGDALRMARLRWRATRETNAQSTATAAEVLEALGFSETIRRAFFRPFFSGVTLDPSLSIPADYFYFLFRAFAQGTASLPRRGMRALPEQLAGSLPPGTVSLGRAVSEVADGSVLTEDGERLEASAVVVATDMNAAHRLFGRPPTPAWRAAKTVYFTADRAPFDEPMLMLNGTGAGRVVHLSVPSAIQDSYAPPGSALISVSVVAELTHGGDEAIEEAEVAEQVKEELAGWFGAAVRQWRWLRTFDIPCAQPKLPRGQGTMSRPGFEVIGPRMLSCGDHLATPSLHGALLAGRAAAEHLLAHTEVSSNAERASA